MGLFRKKVKTEEIIDDKVQDDGIAEVTDDGKVSASARSDVPVIPQAVDDVLKSIKESHKEDGMVEVEVDDDGNEITTEEAKDGEVTDPAGEGLEDLSEDGSGKDTSEAEAVDGEPEYEEIDPRLVDAGRAMGYTDDKIRGIADFDESILTDIADRLEEKSDHREDKDEVVPVKEDTPAELSEETIKELREKHGDEVVDTFILPQLKTRSELDSIKAKLGKVDEFEASEIQKAEHREVQHQSQVADKVFDASAKDFEEIGQTKDVKRYPDGKPVDTPQLQVRNKIFGVASMFHQNGMPFEQAMTEAMTWYAGQTKESRLQRKLVKDVKKQSRKFSPKPTRRKVKKVFRDDRHKAADIVAEAKKKAGIKT